MTYELERGHLSRPINPNVADCPDPSIRVGRDRWPSAPTWPLLFFPPAWPLIALKIASVSMAAAPEGIALCGAWLGVVAGARRL